MFTILCENGSDMNEDLGITLVILLYS